MVEWWGEKGKWRNGGEKRGIQGNGGEKRGNRRRN